MKQKEANKEETFVDEFKGNECGIRTFNPTKQDYFCKRDFCKISKRRDMQNPKPEKKEVYAAFFDYLSEVCEQHPS